ncbi:MAG: hypothetical protein ABIL69_03175 [candidate division WOR-3 bacterium]
MINDDINNQKNDEDGYYTRLYRSVWCQLNPDYYLNWRKIHPDYWKYYYKKLKTDNPNHAAENSRRFREKHPGYYQNYRLKNRKKLRRYWRMYKRKIRAKMRKTKKAQESYLGDQEMPGQTSNSPLVN